MAVKGVSGVNGVNDVNDMNGVNNEKSTREKAMAEQRRCVICAAGPVGNAEALRPLLRPDDWVIAADGGVSLARRLGLTPSLLVADFDSSRRPGEDWPGENAGGAGVPVASLPVKKDDTDTMAAARIALERGFRDFLILGGTGGRLDHTAANFAVLLYLRRQGARAVMADEHGWTEMLLPGRCFVEPETGMKLSLLPYAGEVTGLSVKNVEYPLEKATLTPDFPLGVSNEFTGPYPVEIEFEMGILQLFLSKD